MKKVMGIVIALVCVVGLSTLVMADELEKAIAAKDKAKVKAMLEKDKGLATKKGKYVYPLNAAASAGDLEIVKLLVEAGADVNAKVEGRWNSMPIFSAVVRGNKDLVKYLIEKGADVKSANDEGWTLLHFCFRNIKNAEEIAPMLIAAGVDVNALTKNGDPPLFSTNNEKQARLLLDKGADLTKVDKGNFTALHHFSYIGAIELVKKCLELKMDPNAVTEEEYFELPDGEGISLKKPTPLLIATAMGHLEVVKLLLDAGSDPKAKLGDGSNALHLAALSGKVELAKLFLEKGLEINAVSTEDKATALHAACYNQKKEMVAFLLEKGADPNAIATADDEQLTPLLIALDQENLDLVKLLVDKGANPALAIKWEDGEVNAVDLAWANDYKEALKFFESKGLKADPEKKIAKLYQARALQAEAKTNLGALFTTQVAYYGEYSTYANGEKAFELLGWAPEGETRYAYFVDKAVLKAKIGGPYAVPKEAGEPKSSKDTFIIYAVSNLDDDPTLDVWTINDAKDLVNVINDVEK